MVERRLRRLGPRQRGAFISRIFTATSTAIADKTLGSRIRSIVGEPARRVIIGRGGGMITRTMPISPARICSYLMSGVVVQGLVNNDYRLDFRFYEILLFLTDFYLPRKSIFRFERNVNLCKC